VVEGPRRAQDGEAVVEVLDEAFELRLDALPADGVFDQRVGRVEEDEVRGAGTARERAGAERVTDDEFSAIGAAEFIDVALQDAGDVFVALDEDAAACAAAQGFEADGTGAGKAVEDVDAFEMAAQEREWGAWCRRRVG
jgi:hypothetical protein